MGKNVSKLTGIALATAVAGLFTMTSVGSAFADEGTTADAQVKCDNSTSCKGTGACKGVNNDCKGQNDCKGKGVTMQKDQDTCTQLQEKNRAAS